MGQGLLERKVIIVSGKGGVGKSTVSAILARLASRLKMRVLVIQSDPNIDAPVNLHNMLDSHPFGDKEKELHPGLWAVRTDPETAMRYSLQSVIPTKFLFEQFFQNDLVQGLSEAVPGLREAFIIYYVHAMAVHGSHRRRFDLIVWDAPPTGHLPLYLKAPQILQRMFNTGYVARVLNGLHDFLRDHEKVAISLVTLPEETPVSETLQLIEQIRAEQLGQLGGIALNAYPYPILTEAEAAECRRLLDTPADRTSAAAFYDGQVEGLGTEMLAAAQRRLDVEAAARDAIRPLTTLGLPLWTIPHFRRGRVTLAEVDDSVDRWLKEPRLRRLLVGDHVPTGTAL
ncbi:MAG TPA: ArsA family ATPase [Candidatus Xenobia bacterium]|jgi:anion-transporting  ArsA/GET3 family ATPase